MARLIDADAAKNKVRKEMNEDGLDAFGIKICLALINMFDDAEQLPTIEAEPVRHGRWIKDRDGFHHCSECGENTDRKEDSFGYNVGEFKNPYCGNCGAKMDKEE